MYATKLLSLRQTSRRLFSSQAQKRLDVAIVGLPNAGKSQLLNILTESPVSAVSRKRHTTREGVMGIRTVDDSQIIFVDTPGFLKKSRAEGLERELVVAAAREMDRVDYTVVVVDAAKRITDDVRETLVELMLVAMQSRGRVDIELDEDTMVTTPLQKFSIVLNKVDLVYPKSDLIDIAMNLGIMADECLQFQANKIQQTTLDEDQLEERRPFFFYTSALKEDGVDDVLDALLEKATPGSWEMEAGSSTTLTPEERVEEVIREKIYRCLHKEIPYHIKQTNRLMQTKKDGDKQGLLVHQELGVKTKSHLEIVRGSGSLERIRETAERDLTKLFGVRVVLQLYLKLHKSRNR
jgi:GTP-binding protein Era